MIFGNELYKNLKLECSMEHYNTKGVVSVELPNDADLDDIINFFNTILKMLTYHCEVDVVPPDA